jgi:hypothetical protein
LEHEKKHFHGQHGPPLAMIFAVANHWYLARLGASGRLMLKRAPVKGLRSLHFKVQKWQVSNGHISGIMALVVLVLPSALGIKTELVLRDVGHLALTYFAFVACVHQRSLKNL